MSLFVFIAVTVGKPLLNLASDPEHFRAWVESKGMWGRLFLVGIMCLQVVISLIPGEAIEIGAGYAFGAIEGMVWCLIGSAVGSAIIFAFTKVFGLRLVEVFISREKLNSFKFIQNSNRLNFLVSMVYFIPGTPKDLFAYFVGLTPMKLKTFLLISTFMQDSLCDNVHNRWAGPGGSELRICRCGICCDCPSQHLRPGLLQKVLELTPSST